jgi:hypothetical protein
MPLGRSQWATQCGARVIAFPPSSPICHNFSVRRALVCDTHQRQGHGRHTAEVVEVSRKRAFELQVLLPKLVAQKRPEPTLMLACVFNFQGAGSSTVKPQAAPAPGPGMVEIFIRQLWLAPFVVTPDVRLRLSQRRVRDTRRDVCPFLSKGHTEAG